MGVAMPVTGPKPKAREEIRHRVPPAHDWREFPDVPFEGAPQLPTRSGVSNRVAASAGVVGADEWPKMTEAWYRAVGRMPHAATFTETDWQFVFITAEIHARTVEGWKGYGGTELRQREAMIGTTMDARRDLRIRYVAPPDEQDAASADVVRLNDYRNL